MSNIKFVIHLFVLLLLQLTILDNIQLHSYVYINIYILAIYILPYRLRNATILFFGFFLGLFVDLATTPWVFMLRQRLYWPIFVPVC